MSEENQEPQERPIKEGDVVRLKSGGPHWVVTYVRNGNQADSPVSLLREQPIKLSDGNVLWHPVLETSYRRSFLVRVDPDEDRAAEEAARFLHELFAKMQRAREKAEESSEEETAAQEEPQVAEDAE